MVELIAELATGHGGDVDLACDMVAAAADAGAHTVKIQSYTLARLNPKDPQADWLRQSYLDEKAHERILKACQAHKVQFLSTPFDVESLTMLVETFTCERVKIAATEAGRDWWQPRQSKQQCDYIVSWPWGRKPPHAMGDVHLTAIPLYPTPLEAVVAAPLLDGWSDHTEGLWACRHMMSRGATMIEVHFCLPGRSRERAWDKGPDDVAVIRGWADHVETMMTGVSTKFRERWSA